MSRSLVPTIPPAASRPGEAISPAAARSSTRHENLNLGFAIETGAVGANLDLFAEGRRLQARMIQSDQRHFLFDSLPDDAFARSACMAVARNGDEVFGTVLAHPDADGALLVRTLIVNPAYAGLRMGSALASAVILDAFVRGVSFASVTCAVRVLRDGGLNKPSAKSLDRIGFATEPGIHKARLAGTLRDRHLVPTAEVDEFGYFVRYVRLRGVRAEVVDRSVAMLAEWRDIPIPLDRLLAE
ncbi:hypothetical protein MWN34_10905 [Ancylobacter sp. 6x-1]|uniref:N-acetyltransferase domain-containing protein n=1 Tax=Ancylobacter crimeensis TaxID=2579147 RepID=A0ABT0DBT4_9HYPH|nr:GNAT family N-acetyltransferase [Ancylobacter crimeensis]MCK0197422.1 hypothetical protein [Ancylobacter crimeensis]